MTKPIIIWSGKIINKYDVISDETKCIYPISSSSFDLLEKQNYIDGQSVQFVFCKDLVKEPRNPDLISNRRRDACNSKSNFVVLVCPCCNKY
jgi:hypothetical protein